jgi:DNA-binding response OmpR family regulator
MNRPLAGHSILIVEDEPIIAYEITKDFATAGAKVLYARTINQALLLMDEWTISAAVVDSGLGNADSGPLCELMRRRTIPFIHHSGYSAPRGMVAGEKVVGKPAKDGLLVSIIAELLRARATLH